MTLSEECGSSVPPNPSLALALYVHVPFCRQRCAYCDFNTYAGLSDLMPIYAAALGHELEAIAACWASLTVSTIYLGGGTPSLLSLHLLDDLFYVVRSSLGIPVDSEVSLEVNPGTVTTSYLEGLRALGVNRLSVGGQSTHDDELQMLGRIHTWDDAIRTVESAREAGFENVSLDLMFGLPGQTVGRWEDTLEAALALEPEHLSLYGLSVEGGTPLAERIASEVVPSPDEDRAAAMYELAERMLAERDFFHYEISNWARVNDGEQGAKRPFPRWWPPDKVRDLAPGPSETVSRYVCRHNLTYWRNQPWLGIGAGACSWLAGRRWINLEHPRDYVAVWKESQGGPQDDLLAASQRVEDISRELEIGETMMLGLRLAEGVSDEVFETRFGTSLAEVFSEELEDLQALGLLRWDGSVARLTQRGRLLGNRVFERFI